MLIPILISSIAGLSTIIGSIFIFIKINNSKINKFITFCIAFSLSIMIGISITELIPEAFFKTLSYFHLSKGLILIILISGAGYILIKVVNLLINKHKDSSNLYQLGILSMIVLIIHNLPEGVDTFMSSYKDINLGLKLGLAIMLHNIPEGISIAVPIYYATHSKKKAIFNTFLSGLAEPIGGLLTYLFIKDYITSYYLNLILLFVASIMITLSITKMLPEAIKYKENKFLILGLITGVGFIIINIFILKI